MYTQLTSFLDDHEIMEVFKSGCRSHHSTESAPLSVFNDIFLATDSGNCALLILLDLTAAFDTVDHEIFISRLEQWVGITGPALQGFRLTELFVLPLMILPPPLPPFPGLPQG